MAVVGKMKLFTLEMFGRYFAYLNSHDDNIGVRVLFQLSAKVFELISPGCVYKIVSSKDYCRSQHSILICSSTNRIGYTVPPIIIGVESNLTPKICPLQDLSIYCHNDVCVINCSDWIVNPQAKLLVNDYCANKNDNDKGYVDSATYFQRDLIAIIKKYQAKRHLKCGIRIDGKFSFNYYHNVYENLIRLIALDRFNRDIPQNVPIIIDEQIVEVPSYWRIFEILTSSLNREIVILKRGEMVKVEKLYSISAINNIVPVHMNHAKAKVEDYVFDKDYLLAMREHLLMFKSDRQFPKRIFLTRKKTTHRRINEHELFGLLKPYGFEMVAPEEYTFEEQMKLFNDAEWIVGCSGAAFTNLLFCSPNCTSVCFDRYGTVVPVFTTPASLNGAKMYYIQSEPNSSSAKLHSDFTINPDIFRKFVAEYIIPSLEKE